ncbi:DUF5320 domain-containing protein [Marinifilum fragile]|uniref:DUF5320 domain-containing protein n=1 Tax=Marinifilum fragile TaxID=570161 RepID=UPI002AA90FB7|nr:DUF5320 domain-containing protein [Marinifilum fragile]
MPKLDGTGPDGKGSGTGRKLGKCASVDMKTQLEKLGEGRGLKRKSGCGNGQGKRLQSGKII